VCSPTAFRALVPEGLGERMSLSEELVRLADHVADPWFRATAFTRRLHAAFEACDAPTADHWTGRLLELGESTPHPPAQWNSLCFAATGALLHGDLTTCEELADRAFAIGLDIRLEDVLLIYGVQLMAVRQWQGRWDEVVDLLADAVDQNPRLAALRSLLAWAYTDLGRFEEARALIDAEDPAAVPEDFLRLSALVYLAEPTARRGSPERRAALYETAERTMRVSRIPPTATGERNAYVSNAVQVKWNGAVVDTVGPVAGGTDTAWIGRTVHVTDYGSSATLEFVYAGRNPSGNAVGAYIDDVKAWEN
jgi:hypothetical protein